MSTIIVKTKENIDTLIASSKGDIRDSLREATSKIFGTNSQSIIVDFEKWGAPSPAQAPDILFRAETSLSRRHLLKQWGQSILDAWKDFLSNKNISLPQNMRVAAKAYVIDSEWIEEK